MLLTELWAFLTTESAIYGINIIILITLFLALSRWAWSKRQVVKFEAYAAIPLEDEAAPSLTRSMPSNRNREIENTGIHNIDKKESDIDE